MNFFKCLLFLIILCTIKLTYGQKDIHDKLVAYETASLEEKMALFFYFAPIFDLEKKDSILYYVNDLLDEGLSIKRLDAVALANYGIATFLMSNSLFDEAYNKLAKAEDYYLKNDIDSMLSMVYIDFGNTAFLQGNISKAEVYYNKSAKYAAKTGDIRYELLPTFNLARIYISQGKYEVSKRMIQKYIDNVKSNLTKLASAYGLMGQLFLDQSKLDEAINYFTKSMEAGLASGNIRSITNGYTNLAIAEYFSENYKLSEKYFRIALDYRIKEKNKYYIAEGYYNLGDFYYRTGKLDSSIVNYSMSLKIAEESQNLTGQKDALTELAKLYDTIGQQENQISVLNKIISVQQEIAKNQSYKEVSTLKLSYSQSEKEAANSFGIREDDLQEKVMSYESVFRRWAWLIVSGLLFLALTFYFLKRPKKHN